MNTHVFLKREWDRRISTRKKKQIGTGTETKSGNLARSFLDRHKQTDDKKEVNARDCKMEISRLSQGMLGSEVMPEKGKCVCDISWKPGFHYIQINIQLVECLKLGIGSLEIYVISSMTIALTSKIVIWTILKLHWGLIEGFLSLTLGISNVPLSIK